MLSVCIPIYNFEVSDLIEGLLEQGRKLSVPFELILIDDYSSEDFKLKNEFSCCKTTYIQLEKNIGRSKIRNLFLQYTKYEYLLFLDCDVKITSMEFIKNYLKFIELNKPKVIVGGRIYPEICPCKNQYLSWKYGIVKESKSLVSRLNEPERSFMSNNFVIEKNLLQQIKFEEQLQNYGHEDSLFGFSLLRKSIIIHHLENPILNIDIEDNETFIVKTEFAIKNLILIKKLIDDSNEFTKYITLLKVHEGLKRLNLLLVLSILFKLLSKRIKNRLIKGKVNLFLFDFYKLGFYNQELKNQSK